MPEPVRKQFSRHRLRVAMLAAACVLLPSLLWVAADSRQVDDGLMHCSVASINDGDTLRVRCNGTQNTIRVRLQQIDAPELQQEYGTRARDHLRQLCRRDSEVKVLADGHDQYGRLLGDVVCGGKSATQEMVSSGYAWVYTKHNKDKSLLQLEQQAKQARRGLWAGKDPQAPWRWRYEQRNR